MKTFIISLALLVICVSSVTQASPSTSAGQRLHKQSCQGCHDDSMYNRQDTIIFSYKALRNRVHFCERMSGASWKEQQLNSVIDYLNDRYYKFNKK